MISITQKPVTFSEFLESYPEDGGIYELIRGEIIEMNPAGKHEEIIAFMVAEFNFEIRRQQLHYFLPRTCTVKPHTPDTAYKPDITVINRNLLTDEPLWEKSSTIIYGKSSPLIVEVVSTNWRDDYGYKLIDYESMGIAEYWIADYLALGGKRYIGSPKQPTITVCQLLDGEYQLQQFKGSDRLISATFPELNLTAEQVFRAGN